MALANVTFCFAGVRGAYGDQPAFSGPYRTVSVDFTGGAAHTTITGYKRQIANITTDTDCWVAALASGEVVVPGTPGTGIICLAGSERQIAVTEGEYVSIVSA